MEIRQLEAKFKHDFTPNDSLLLRIVDYESSGGDIRQTFSEEEVPQHSGLNRSSDQRLRSDTTTSGLLRVVHFCSLVDWTMKSGRLIRTRRCSRSIGFGTLNGIAPVFARHEYEARREVYSAELQHILQSGRHT